MSMATDRSSLKEDIIHTFANAELKNYLRVRITDILLDCQKNGIKDAEEFYQLVQKKILSEVATDMNEQIIEIVNEVHSALPDNPKNVMRKIKEMKD